MQLVDLSGKRFGRLLVVAQRGRKGKRVIWECRCDCGALCYPMGCNLSSGHTTSCGCARDEIAKSSSVTHGASRKGQHTPEYRSWAQVRRRCLSKTDPKYPDYGGRGIAMCDRWRDDFAAFLEDMGLRPDGFTIERNNVNGNYDPENCRWASTLDQARNKTSSRLNLQTAQRIRVEYQTGLSQRALAKKYGIHQSEVSQIIRGAIWIA